MLSTKKKARRGFSLVELVIVIVIIGVIAAIAIPRFSRGAAGADESALMGNLASLRQSIELYGAEHNQVYPGAKADGLGGIANSEASFLSQMTKFSKLDGSCSATKDVANGYKFGPYLRGGMAPLPVGTNRGSRTVSVLAAGPAAVNIAGGFGWVYAADTGEIIANADDTDESGSRTYDQY